MRSSFVFVSWAHRKPKYFSISLMVSISLLFTNSCVKKGGGCEGQTDVVVGYIGLQFEDANSGENLYPKDDNGKFDRDDFRVTDEENNDVTQEWIDQTYYYSTGISPYYLASDKSSFDSELCKNFFIHYSATQTDTLQVCFRSHKKQCGSDFSLLKLSQNGRAIDSVENDITLLVKLKK